MPSGTTIAAFLYAAVPFLVGLYLLLVDAGILKDKTGKDEFYLWVRGNRIVFLLIAAGLMLLAAFEFFRFLEAAR